MDIKTLKKYLPIILESNITPMIIGHYGIGKSQIIKEFAEELKYKFIDLRLGTQETGDLLGLPEFERDSAGKAVRTKFFKPEWFPTSSKCIIFLDELNRARRDVLQAVFQLILDKRLHTHKLPSKCYIIAAMNPNTEEYIVTDINDRAFLDRFIFIKLTPTKEEWIKYANDNNFNQEIIDFIKVQPECLEDKFTEFSLRDYVKPSRRSWEFVNRLYSTIKAKNINIEVQDLTELIAGLVGYEAASSFVIFINDKYKIIEPHEIVTNFNIYKSTILEYSENGHRIDLLNKMCDNLLNYIKKRSKNNELFSNVEQENIVEFLMSIPKDLAFSFCRSLYLEEESFRTILDNSKKLQKMLFELRK